MKRPKEPKKFLRPRMYYQDAWGRIDGSLNSAPRIRIIYPNGKTLWLCLGVHYARKLSSWHKWREPCWHDKIMSVSARLEQMHWYDRKCCWKRAVFLGEL